MVKNLFSDIQKNNPNVKEADWENIFEQIQNRMDNEPPPKIAVIGYTGVGKTSTLNALFNANLAISHTHAQTQTEQALDIKLQNIHAEKGLLRVYDMPGLGESIFMQAQHLVTYKRVLLEADVAIWILEAHDRSISYIQEHLKKDIQQINPKLLKNIVFALNKVDLIHPGETDWNPYINMPSQEGQAGGSEQKGTV